MSGPLLWVCERCFQGNPTELNSCAECGAARPAICEYRRGDAPRDQPRIVFGIGCQLAGYTLLVGWVPNGTAISLALICILLGFDLHNKGRGQ